MWFLEQIKKEWNVIKSAPIAFLFLMFVGWGIIQWFYHGTITALKETRDAYISQNASLKGQLSTYEQNKNNSEGSAVGQKGAGKIIANTKPVQPQLNMRDNNGALAIGDNAKAEFNNVISKPYDPLSKDEKALLIDRKSIANGNLLEVFRRAGCEDLALEVKNFLKREGANVVINEQGLSYTRMSDPRRIWEFKSSAGNPNAIYISRNRIEN